MHRLKLMQGTALPCSQSLIWSGKYNKKEIKMKLLSIYDKQTGYNPPVVHATEGAAIRWFGELCNDEKNVLYKHPEDFELKVIGEFDEYKGVHNLCEPVTIAKGTQFAVKTID